MNIFCRLGWHSFHTAPNGMLRYCPNCNRWEVNRNNSADPIHCWREISDDTRQKLVEDWFHHSKLL